MNISYNKVLVIIKAQWWKSPNFLREENWDCCHKGIYSNWKNEQCFLSGRRDNTQKQKEHGPPGSLWQVWCGSSPHAMQSYWKENGAQSEKVFLQCKMFATLCLGSWFSGWDVCEHSEGTCRVHMIVFGTTSLHEDFWESHYFYMNAKER